MRCRPDVGSIVYSLVCSALAVTSFTQVVFATTLTEKDTPLAAPENVMVFAMSPAADRVAFVVQGKSHKRNVVLDGVTGDPVDDVKAFGGKKPVLFSTDGKHTAYMARQGKAFIVIVDAKVGPTFDDIGEPRFSTDGSTVAYIGAAEGKSSLVTVSGGNATSKELASLSGDRVADVVALSNDLKHFAYVAAADNSATVVIDGTASDKFSSAEKPIFSADGNHCGYLAKTPKAGGDDDEWIVIDGNKTGPFHNLSALTFSPDGKHYAAIRALSGNGMPTVEMPHPQQEKAAVIRDGKIDGDYDAINPPLVFSPDSNRLAYAIDSGSTRAWIIDGKAEPAYQNVHTLVFSPDSKRVAYGAESAKGVEVVVDEMPGPIVRDVSDEFAIVFSPDSKHVAYVATDERSARTPMLDGVVVGTPSPSWAPHVVFSPDSKHLVAQDKKHMSVDGVAVQQPMLDSWPVVFDGDSRFHFIFTQTVQVNRRPTRTFDRLDIEIH